VFNLYVFEEFTHSEIAYKLGISAGTSKWHLSNARKVLREKILAVLQKA
jgi:RNA polymerase sigma-70 factor (ECF subfamily)